MAVKKYYIGGMGPYLYDDTVDLLDPEGDFTGETQHGFITDGTISSENHVINGLTASRLLSTDANKKIVSVTNLASWIAGTTNQITVTNDGDGTITLSLSGVGTLIVPSGTTANRPGSPTIGRNYFDTTLGIPIWYNGSNWINATGTTV